MVSRIFKIKKIDLEKKPLTVFQHKLRVLMKCYTIRDLILNELECSYRFKKSHKISGLKFDDSKEYQGRYEIEEIEGQKTILLKLII
jgi:hypothetical protein